MMAVNIIVISCGAILFFATRIDATKVRACQGTRKLDATEVAVNNCEKGICVLRRNTSPTIVLKFKPEEDIKELKNVVSALIVDIPFPFIGVDGTSACNQVYEEDGTTKASCPLKKGVSYVYKNEFKVLDVYPRISLVVKYAIQSNGKNVACFELPAKIV